MKQLSETWRRMEWKQMRSTHKLITIFVATSSYKETHFRKFESLFIEPEYSKQGSLSLQVYDSIIGLTCCQTRPEDQNCNAFIQISCKAPPALA